MPGCEGTGLTWGSDAAGDGTNALDRGSRDDRTTAAAACAGCGLETRGPAAGIAATGTALTAACATCERHSRSAVTVTRQTLHACLIRGWPHPGQRRLRKLCRRADRGRQLSRGGGSSIRLILLLLLHPLPLRLLMLHPGTRAVCTATRWRGRG